jgi:PAS domain S-box-containing protein
MQPRRSPTEAMSTAATAPRGSLRRRLLLPMVALGVAVAALAVWAIHLVGERQLTAELRCQATQAARAVVAAATSCTGVDELQQIVLALGADATSTLIVVAGGMPAQVIAATHPEWIGRPLAELPHDDVGEPLAAVLGAERVRDTPEHGGPGHGSGRLLRAERVELAATAHGAGAVLVHLDVGPGRRTMQATATVFAAAFLVILIGTGLLGYRLLSRHVLSPLAGLGRSFARGEHRDDGWEPARRDDEIGELAGTLQQTVRLADAARRALEDLEYAFDQHSIVAVTDAAGVITHVNDRFCAVSRYAREELIGRTHAILGSGHHDAAFFAELWATIAAGRTWRGEICNRAKDGALYWVDSTIVPLLDSNGRPTRYIAIRTEITLRKQADRELITARDAAESAARAKADFLAMMSHELRTPMNGVVGFTDLLLDTELAPEQRRFTTTIQSSAEALLCIIDDILDISKIEAGRLVIEAVPLDLEATICEVLALMTPRLRAKGLTAQLEFAVDAPRRLHGDPTRLRQVLFNLVGNAIKFTATGGVTIAVTAAPERLRIAVSDTGIGIPTASQRALFTRFTQVDATTTRRFGGTGLGLAIAKSLVELMGGEIGLDSAPDRGATFWFTLPRREVATNDPGAAVDPGPSTAAYGLRVLVAEDNTVGQELIHRLLARFGCCAVVAANGAIAVELFREQPFDLVLMDCQMPELDGLAATQAIRAFEHAAARMPTPIFALTAGVTDQERAACAAAGMDGFLAKPVRPRLLAQTLREAALQLRPSGRSNQNRTQLP